MMPSHTQPCSELVFWRISIQYYYAHAAADFEAMSRIQGTCLVDSQLAYFGSMELKDMFE